MKTASTVLRVMGLAAVFTVLLGLASRLTTPPELTQRMTSDQVAQSLVALPAASLVITGWLAYLALRSRWHGWKLAGATFAILYGLYTFLGQLEMIAFPAATRGLPGSTTTGFLLSGLIVALPFSPLLVWALGKARRGPDAGSVPHLEMPLSEWVWKTVAGVILYVAVYFTFGYFVAWRTPGLPEFYGSADTGSFLGQLLYNVRTMPWIFGLQAFRGLVWTGIGCVLIRMHKGRPWETILATGLTFTVVMNASLLFPNPFMPPAVAHAHAVELVSSNLVYGIFLAALMLWRPRGRQLSIQQAGAAP